MTADVPATWLLGRHEEMAHLTGAIAATRDGMSRALVVRGEAGVGKTALLRAAADDASDVRHLRLAGVESETGLPFAGLQRFVQPYLSHAGELPDPQRGAIDVALGRSLGQPPDPYLVGLATLNLLAAVASGQPTLVTVDDAHWLDRESLRVLAFAARRLDAEAVAMVFAARTGTDLSPLDDLDTLDVGDLDADDAMELLRLVVDVPVDQRVADHVIRSIGGNPLALRELGGALTAAQLDGSERLPEPLTVGRRLEDHYAGVIAELPAGTRTWLLLAAAESTGDLGAVEAAAALVGLPAGTAGPAERAGIVSIRTSIEFRHPLVRSAIYSTQTAAERQAAHGALARSIPEHIDPDRRAIHLAGAATGPDEEVAAELERAAARARRRGGLTARADLLARAAALTPDPTTRSLRLLDAADAALRAGAGRQSQALLDSISVDTLGSLDRARCRLLQANVAALSGEQGKSAQISAECLAAARMAGDEDPEFTQQALFEACLGAMTGDRLIQGTTVAEIARMVRASPPAAETVTSSLATAFATLAADGYAVAVPAIRRAIGLLLDPATPDDMVLDRYLLGISLTTVMLDYGSGLALEERVDRIARSTGALGTIDILLYAWSMTHTILGDLDRADDLLAEGVQLHTVLARSSREFDVYRHPELAAWRGGDRAPIDELIRTTAEAGTWVGIGSLVAACDVAGITLELSCGGYRAAKDLALRLIDGDGFAMHTRVLPDLVEAAVRDGDADVARWAIETFTERATASGTPFALAALARATALTSPEDEAAAAYERAIHRFGELGARGELGRSHLVYGEWLRRRRQTSDAREHLQIAYQVFTDMGAEGFAERARVEVAASGGRARRRAVVAADTLTTQERQIAILAADGLTNSEIGSRLYISPQTVDYHLRKVYRKLDIGSRRQLRGRTL